MSKNPFESLESTINTSSRDFSQSKDLIWIYGIVSGWDNDSLKEFEKKYWWWTPEESKRLKALHKNYLAAKKDYTK